MNNTYDEIKEAESQKETFSEDVNTFIRGWEAHEALDLPILFYFFVSGSVIFKREDMGNVYWYYNSERYTLPDLYQYWITEIYKTDQS